MAVKIKWNYDGFRTIRTLPAVMDLLDAQAERIRASCGPDYHANPAARTGGRVRGRASVATSGAKGARTEAQNHYLARGGEG